MMRLIFLLAAILGTSFLFGCGQSGPLYLPGDPSEVREAPRPEAEDADDDQEDADGSR